MKAQKKKIEFEFITAESKRGTPLRFIKFSDPNFRLTDSQKETLKAICKGYFFYSTSRRMWGLTKKGNNEVDVYNYLHDGTLPNDIYVLSTDLLSIQHDSNAIEKSIPFKLEDFDVKFIELRGRPLFYHEIKDGIIEIYINLNHWFFVNRDSSEKEFARKLILSLVGTELEFTSQLIENYFIKLNCIQDNLKYSYDKSKR
jgi:hypothetical protein